MELQEFAASFVESTRSYIFIRPEDRLLILRPNQVHYLNDSAVEMLSALYKQSPVDVSSLVAEFARIYQQPEYQIAQDLQTLLQSLSLLLQGKTGLAPAVRSMPFGSHQRKYPVLSEIALTYRCNNRCFFCYASAPQRGHREAEIETARKPPDRRGWLSAGLRGVNPPYAKICPNLSTMRIRKDYAPT